MADVASLAVGLHLNAASFKSQLLGAYGDAENQSRRFNRNAQADAKKTEDAYKKVGLSISGMASRLAGLAGAGLSIGTIVTTSRQYGQALCEFNMKGETRRRRGFIAQQAEKVDDLYTFPGIEQEIDGEKFRVMNVDYTAIIADLVTVVQDLIKRVELHEC